MRRRTVEKCALASCGQPIVAPATPGLKAIAVRLEFNSGSARLEATLCSRPCLDALLDELLGPRP